MGARGARFARRFGRLLGAHSPHPRGPIKAPPRVTRMGARGPRFVRRFGRLLGAHSRHPRGPIKAPPGWREWAPRRRVSYGVLGAHSRHPPGPIKALAGDRNGGPGGAFRWAFWAPLGRPLPPPAGADQGPPRVTRSGARGPRFARRFGRLSGPHCRHSRGPIRAPCGWGEWASGGCLPLFVLVAFWAPIPANRGGRSRPRRVAGMGARWVPFPFRSGRPGGAFPLVFWSPRGAPPPLPLCPPTFRLCCPPCPHRVSLGLCRPAGRQ